MSEPIKTSFFHPSMKIRNSSVAESDCSKCRRSSFHSVHGIYSNDAMIQNMVFDKLQYMYTNSKISQCAIKKNKKGTLFIYFYRIHDDIHLVTHFRATNQALNMNTTPKNRKCLLSVQSFRPIKIKKNFYLWNTFEIRAQQIFACESVNKYHADNVAV